MGLETGTYINSLNISNPLGADRRHQGDDHLRLLKATLKNTFPDVNAAVNPTVTQFNKMAAFAAGELPVVRGAGSAIQHPIEYQATSVAHTAAGQSLAVSLAGPVKQYQILSQVAAPLDFTINVQDGITGGFAWLHLVVAYGIRLHFVPPGGFAFSFVSGATPLWIDPSAGHPPKQHFLFLTLPSSIICVIPVMRGF